MTPQSPQDHKKKNITTFFTVFFLTLGVLTGMLFLIIYLNPYIIINPFPPEPPVPNISQHQVDIALSQTLQNLSPSETQEPSFTATQEPTSTAQSYTPTLSPTKAIINSTPTPDSSLMVIYHKITTQMPDSIFHTVTPTPKTGYIFPFILVNEPILKESPYNDNVSNALLNCNWIGVAGQVFNFIGNPLEGITVHLSGSIDGVEIKQQTMLSGESNLLGAGGFEFMLSEKPFNSQNALWLQIISLDGVPLSAKAHFSTTVHCTQNLIKIDFMQVQ